MGVTKLSDLAGLAEETWIATRADTQGAATVGRLCRLAGFEPDIHFRSNNYAVLQGLVAAGMGVAIAPALALEEHAVIWARRVADPEATRTVSVVFSPGVPRGLAEVFTTALRRAGARLLGDFVHMRPLADESSAAAEAGRRRRGWPR